MLHRPGWGEVSQSWVSVKVARIYISVKHWKINEPFCVWGLNNEKHLKRCLLLIFFFFSPTPRSKIETPLFESKTGRDKDHDPTAKSKPNRCWFDFHSDVFCKPWPHVFFPESKTSTTGVTEGSKYSPDVRWDGGRFGVHLWWTAGLAGVQCCLWPPGDRWTLTP